MKPKTGAIFVGATGSVFENGVNCISYKMFEFDENADQGQGIIYLEDGTRTRYSYAWPDESILIEGIPEDILYSFRHGSRAFLISDEKKAQAENVVDLIRQSNFHFIKTPDEKFTDSMMQEGYFPVRKLPTGKWVGCFQMNYTGALIIGLDESGYEKRYCYASIYGAMAAALTWDGLGDPPGNWIKEKGNGVDRLNPKIEENFE